ncbi:hypothetical protein [Lysobacter sp. CA199]|uniref:hypothetical protein n=1 Tax=Lysobacter sp. CA199 TaxID=3455608 RepID=UPI003F8D3838
MSKPKHELRPSRKAAVYLPLGVVLLLMLVLAAAAMDPFVPSPEAAWLGPAVLLLAAAATLALILATAVRSDESQLTSWAHWRDAAIGMLFYAGFFFVLYVVLRLCVPLLLHHLAGTRPAVQVEAVQVHESMLVRGCRNAAVLPGDSLLLRRRVCRVPKNLVGALRDSGRIQLRGTRSYFGIQVEDYSVAPPSR